MAGSRWIILGCALAFAAWLVLETTNLRDWLVFIAIAAIVFALVWGYYRNQNKIPM